MLKTEGWGREGEGGRQTVMILKSQSYSLIFTKKRCFEIGEKGFFAVGIFVDSHIFKFVKGYRTLNLEGFTSILYSVGFINLELSTVGKSGVLVMQVTMLLEVR